MTNDNHANYAKIGLAVLLGAIGIAVTLIYIAGVGSTAQEFLLETYYDNPVSGLAVGSDVNFRGVKIGEVRDIDFAVAMYPHDDLDEADSQRIVIIMAMDVHRILDHGYDPKEIFEAYVARGLRATVASSGITGLSHLELNVHENPDPPAQLAWKPQYPLVPPQPSLMDSISDAATKAINRFNTIDFVSVWSNVDAIASSTAQVTRDVSELVASERSRLEKAIENAEVATRNIAAASEAVSELAEALKDNPSMLLRPNDPQALPETAQ